MKKIIVEKTNYKPQTFKLLLIIFISFFSFTFFTFTQAWSTTYYIDFVSGLDTNNGRSTSTPFKRCPGDDNATGVARLTTLSSGDKVIFKGGVSYIGQVNINWSGSGDGDTNRIIYDGDSGNYVTRWAAETYKAIMNANLVYGSCFSFSGVRSYITINNFEMKNTTLSYGLIYNGSASNYVNISNNKLHTAGTVDGTGGDGKCIKTNKGNYWNIHDNTLYDCRVNGISLGNGSFNKIYNNVIYGHISWPLTISNISPSDDMTDNEIYNNIMYDIAKSLEELGNPGSHGNWLWIFTADGSGGPTGDLKNTKIYNNLFYQTVTSSGQTSGALHFQNDSVCTWDGLYLFNNVVFNNDAKGIMFGNKRGTIKNFHVYGNTFYSPGGVSAISITGGAYSSNDPTNFSNLFIKNNISMGTGALITVPRASEMSGIVEINNNFYSSSKSDGKVFATMNGLTGVPTIYTLSGWKALGYDATVTDTTTDPLFVNTTVGSNFDLRLQSGSPGIDAGYTLGASYNTDKNGISRPQGSGWDFGAYEFIPINPGAPIPPSNFRVIQ